MTHRAATPPTLGSDTRTKGFRVRVRPSYLPEHSDPEARRWVFGYEILISNENSPGSPPARLLSRHWIIVDADGERHEVSGEGVVGRQPCLAPGESHEYASFCPLPTEWGTMEGEYRFRVERDDGGAGAGEEFDVRVGRFYLAPPRPAPRRGLYDRAEPTERETAS